MRKNLHEIKETIRAIPGVKSVEYDFLNELIVWVKIDSKDHLPIIQVQELLAGKKYFITANITNVGK